MTGLRSRLPRPPRRLHPAWRTAALALALAGAGCDDAPQAPPSDAELLLVVDGIEIRMPEVQPYLDYLASIAPEWGAKSRMRAVLDEYVLPVRLSQRAFPAERAKMREQAFALRSVASNLEELERQSKQLTQDRKVYARRQVDLPLSMFLFDPLLTGAVSDPIEFGRGWLVASCIELKESPVKFDDLADSLVVVFATHEKNAWNAWIGAERQRVAGKVTYVHPEYREAMPEWLKLP